MEKTSEIDLDVQNFERSNPSEGFGTQTFKLERAGHQITGHTKDISLLFRLLEQATFTIEQQQHQMRILKSEQQNFKQLISILQEQIIVEIKKGAILGNQLIATREQLDGIKSAELPWNILSVAMKPFRTNSDIDLLKTAIEDDELKVFIDQMSETYNGLVAKDYFQRALHDIEKSNADQITNLKASFNAKIAEIRNHQHKQIKIVEDIHPIMTSVAFVAMLSLVISGLRFLQKKI